MEKTENPEKLIQKAEKLLKPGFFKAIFSNTEDRVEKAIELYNTAGQIYIIEKQYKKAGECFEESSKLKKNIKESPEEDYKKAINCYKKINDIENYNRIMNLLINYYIKENEFSEAANLQFEISKELSKNKNKINEALESFDKCLDFYNMDKDSSKISISKTKIEKANLITFYEIKDEILYAHNIYDEVGKEKMESSTGKFLAQEFFAKNVITYLVYDDVITAKAYLHKYYDIDSNFENSGIGNLIEDLITIFENEESNNLTNDNQEILTVDKVVLNFSIHNKNNKFYDYWMEEMINKIKKKIEIMRKEQVNFAEEMDFK